jgi:Druantia protein DruA
MAANGPTHFTGREIGPSEMATIREVVGLCSGVTRMELANTICELLGWSRASGGLKGRECRELLERLEAEGVLALPEKRKGRPVGSRTRVPVSGQGEPGRALAGSAGEFAPVVLEPVCSGEERLLFRELVGRYHYLGHKVPFGAHLRYLVYVSKPERQIVGCLQFSSPAWRMAARERWIGWNEAARKRNLQKVVNNSRFLIVPWIRIRNLASSILSLAAHRIRDDWRDRYATDLLLAETLVDSGRFRGSCYRAANWIHVGSTTGRGRMDREHRREDLTPKAVFLYPLVKDARRQLQEE